MRERVRGEVNWTDLRRRLDSAGAFSEVSGDRDDTRVRRILEERAARLAASPTAGAETAMRDVVTFRLGAETCAVDASIVLNVFRLGSVARLPGVPPPAYGVTIWRGEALTLLDIRGLLGISTTALSDLGRVIVLGRTRARFGFLADRALGVEPIPRDDVHAAPRPSASATDIVAGITSSAMLLLDTDRLLNLSITRADA